MRTIKEFYDLMSKLRDTRAGILNEINSGRKFKEDDLKFLKSVLESLENVEKEEGKHILLDSRGRKIKLMFHYEISELKKDIIFLEKGREGLLLYLEKIHKNFSKEVEDTVKKIKGKKFEILFSDRDGTLNNYSERYLSSIQSIYNAFFLLKFIRKVEKAVILSSAPLAGLKKISIMNHKNLIYAGSKGLEFDSEGKTKTYPIGKKEKTLLEGLSGEISKLLKEEENRKFSLIGSGFQKKLGQLTVARQDISGSVGKNESEKFLKKVKAITQKFNKAEKNFVVRDTGLDIEITLVNESVKKDFTKKDGIDFIMNFLGEKEGNIIVCGDTEADLEMLKISGIKREKVHGLFVAKNKRMKDKLKKKRNVLHISEPDILVSILERLGNK